jgi:hypothetical protein
MSESAYSVFIDPIGRGTGNPGEYQRQAMEDSDDNSDDYQDSEEDVLPVIQLKSISPKRSQKRGNKRGKKKGVKSTQHLDDDAMSDNGESEQMTLNSTIDNDLTDNGYSSEEDALPTTKTSDTTKQKEVENRDALDNTKVTLIARNEFPHDGALTCMYMLQILGDRSSRMTVEQLDMYEKKVTTLKVKVLSFMKTWIKRKWQRMVEKDPNLLSNVKDLQKQWGDMNVNDKAEVDRTY